MHHRRTHYTRTHKERKLNLSGQQPDTQQDIKLSDQQYDEEKSGLTHQGEKNQISNSLHQDDAVSLQGLQDKDPDGISGEKTAAIDEPSPTRKRQPTSSPKGQSKGLHTRLKLV